MPYFYTAQLLTTTIIAFVSYQNVLCPSCHETLVFLREDRGSETSLVYSCSSHNLHFKFSVSAHIAQSFHYFQYYKAASQKPLLGSSKTIWYHQQISPSPLGLINTLNKHDPGVNSRSYYNEPLSLSSNEDCHHRTAICLFANI